MELVLVLPVILMVTLLVVEVAVVARASLAMAGAAREGARVAATTSDTDAAIDATIEALGPDLAAVMRVTVRRPATVGRPTTVTVAGDHRALSWVGGVRVPLEFSATMRVER